MEQSDHSGLLISDFNLGNFANYLRHDEEVPEVEVDLAPYGQVAPLLIDHGADCWAARPRFVVVWTRPQGVIGSFERLLSFREASLEQILSEVDSFSNFLLQLPDCVEAVFVPTWILPSHERGLGLLDLKSSQGVARVLSAMNLRLMENLETSPRVFVLNTQRWVEQVGKTAFHPKLWYLAKIPFANDVFLEAVKDFKAALRGLAGQSRKLILLDLDNTLWGGIVGEDGWQNLRLGGHDPIGEAFVDFQRHLKALTRRGVVLGIVSKNQEEVALEAMDRHREMVLRREDFAGWRINWQDKAENVVELAAELRLGLEAVVFIDDSPAERARVSRALPEVLVPDWPQDYLLYAGALRSLRCFDVPSLTGEDRQRARTYAAERQRVTRRTELSSVEEWLEDLDIRVQALPLGDDHLPRATQLLNRTNQMNLRTRRLTESELKGWARAGGRKVWTFRVSDKFGDSGLTGLVSLEAGDEGGEIVDFVLSCRVIGRKVEESMLHTVIAYARSAGLETVRARYFPTARNKPCLDFWRRSGFRPDESLDVFAWSTRDAYPVPECIQYSS